MHLVTLCNGKDKKEYFHCAFIRRTGRTRVTDHCEGREGGDENHGSEKGLKTGISLLDFDSSLHRVRTHAICVTLLTVGLESCKIQ